MGQSCGALECLPTADRSNDLFLCFVSELAFSARLPRLQASFLTCPRTVFFFDVGFADIAFILARSDSGFFLSFWRDSKFVANQAREKECSLLPAFSDQWSNLRHC